MIDSSMVDTSANTSPVYPVLDARGYTSQWIADGRGVAVWQCIDLSSARIGGYSFTPGDATGAPSWRDTLVERIPNSDCAARLAFYRRGDVLGRWTDTPAGWRAAYRAVEGLERDSAIYHAYANSSPAPASYTRVKLNGRSVLVDRRQEWSAPAGRFARTLTVERVEYQTVGRVAYPLAPAGELAPKVSYDRPVDRPLDTLYTVGIVVWYASLGDTSPA